MALYETVPLIGPDWPEGKSPVLQMPYLLPAILMRKTLAAAL